MKIRCPHCGAHLNVRDELTGKQGRCPRCRKELTIEPEGSGSETPSLDPWAGSQEPSDKPSQQAAAPSDEYGGIEPLRLLGRTRRRKKKDTEPESTQNAVDAKSDAQPKRRRFRKSTGGMLAGVVAGPFWRSALSHFPYLAADLAVVGGLLGFLVVLIHIAAGASLVLQIIGYPTAVLLFFLMCYPASCFFKVAVGSSDSSGDIDEWPESNFGEWVFEMLFVMYMIVIAVLLSGGIAKLREWVAPARSGSYWQLMPQENDPDALSILPKILGAPPQPAPAEAVHRGFQPGTGWQTTFLAFLAIFPLVVMCCLDSVTPIFVPWSPRVFFSLLKNFPAWLVVVAGSGVLLGGGAAILCLGSLYAPFWTFTLCSPLAAAGLLLYGRLLGRLSWLIART
jgi:hypothetical protein